ncbi:CBO0543 family protein [Neobacillus sp. D3-1R]|uniref:CBO0543 family protein n=1 Tax=Neobacillus sp. D3-1R TaxID=3445778 RepID=UPI003F9FB9E1
MHLLIASVLGITAYFKGNWREWNKYHSTILYVVNLNLLYEVLCHDKLLWVYNPTLFPKSQIFTTLIYSFFVLPSITLIFLSNYPFKEGKNKKAFYILKWVIASYIIESIYIYFDKIDLKNGYKHWMEPLFYIVMYLMIRLHFSRPFLTYSLSFVIIVVLLNFFHIPIK